jgi:hypothetical protein
VRQFRRTLPIPVLDPANPTIGGTIPVLSWSPVPGAISYGLHVDKVDGGTDDFTVATSRFTPTVFYGNGIWKWKVRANFPSSSGDAVSGPYTAPTNFLRRVLPPANAQAVITNDRVVFSWAPVTTSASYRLQVAKDDSFTDLIETVTTPNNTYAPLLSGRYGDGGRLYWRVAILDKGNNLGAFARGDLRLRQKLKVKSSAGFAQKRKFVTVKLTVSRSDGKRVRSATVTVSGAGVKLKRKKTGKKGTVTFRIRPMRKGTIKVTAARKGYVSGAASIGVF